MTALEFGNGHSDTENILTNKETAIAVAKELEKIKNSNGQDLNKYQILESLSDPEKIKLHTEFRNIEEVHQMNRLEVWCDMVPIVFGNTKNQKKVQEITAVFKNHCMNHRFNMVSYERKRELAIVHALRNDDSPLVRDSAMKRFVGMK